MSDPLAIAGDFADLKTVKSRATIQVIIEFPIEQGERIVRMFGFPQPSNPAKLALARLAETPQIEGHAQPANGNGKRSWRDLTGPVQAGIRCAEPAFWTFLREAGGSNVNDEDGAANYVRLACGVHSRAEIATKKGAAVLWHDLDTRYQAWLAHA